MARIQPRSWQDSSVHIAAANSATFTLPAASSLGFMQDCQEPVDIRVTTVITCLGTALYSLQSTFTTSAQLCCLITVLSITQYYDAHFTDEIQ